MGRRGPVPLPTILKVLRGNPGGHYINEHEPQPSVDMPDCPEWLDPDAQAKWIELAPQLSAMGVLTLLDGDALVNYCQTWARWVRAEKFVQGHGDVHTIKNKHGELVRLAMVPQVRIANMLLMLLHRQQQEFGMTPSSRTGIHVMPSDNGVESISRFLKIGG